MNPAEFKRELGGAFLDSCVDLAPFRTKAINSCLSPCGWSLVVLRQRIGVDNQALPGSVDDHPPLGGHDLGELA